MAYKIVASCVNCWACVAVCPTDAIHQATPHFLIDEKKCSECVGDYAQSQCASICPIEGAILDSLQLPVNPPGSLTGVTAEKRQQLKAEIQAR